MFANFLDGESAVLQKNLQSGRDILDIFQIVASFYGRIEEGVRDTKEVLVEDRLILLCLFHESFKFWLNGAAVLLRGHLSEFLPLMRGGLESAAYANKIRRMPQLAEIWLQGSDRKREFDAAFRDGGMERQLFPEDDNLVRNLWPLFEIASTFGVHSNRERLAYSIEVRELPNSHSQITFHFGSNDLRMIRKCAGFCVTIAYRMLEVFQPCFEDITALAVWTTEWRGIQEQIDAFLQSVRRTT
ncbi:MAG: hypothetical protein ACE5JQ_15595 [Candidatus Methylomirabilales bacterium]